MNYQFLVNSGTYSYLTGICRQTKIILDFLKMISSMIFIIIMLKDYDRGFKIIIAGSSGVGKSSLLLRYVDNVWSGSTLSTIGVDFKFKSINVNG